MEDQAKQHQKWWQKNKQLLIRTGIVIIVVFAFFALLVYIFGWDWTGFSHKTLWDWLNLIGVLAIPVIAGFGVAWFTQLQQQRDKRLEQTQHEHDQKLADQRAATEREIALDNRREATLQTYIDNMSELLMVKKLSKFQPADEVQEIARIRTLTILPRLDANRKKVYSYSCSSLVS